MDIDLELKDKKKPFLYHRNRQKKLIRKISPFKLDDDQKVRFRKKLKKRNKKINNKNYFFLFIKYIY